MKKIATALFLIFFLFGFAVYYDANIPVQKIAQNLLPLPIALLFVVSLCGLGSLPAGRLVPIQDKWVHAISAVAIGTGLTGIYNLLTGILFHFTAIAFAVWHAAGIVLFVFACRKWRPFPIGVPAKTSWNALAVCVFAVFLIPLVPFFVAPEVSTDAITYHLLIPKIYLLHGKIHFLPLFVEAYYPNLAELNYVSMLSLTSEIVCKCFHFWMGILVLILISRFIKKSSPASSGMLASALFLSMPVVAIHLGWAWNDFLFVLLILLCLYFLLMAQEPEFEINSSKYLLAAGVMMGLASWTKYTFVLYFFATLLLLLYGARKWKWNPARYPYYFAGVAVVAPFWLFQNWWFTGNPVYPFLNRIFHSPFWTETANQYFIHHLRRYEIQNWNWSTYFTFPAKLTLTPSIIETHTGILPFAFIPLLFLSGRTKAYRLLRGFLVSSIIVWLFIQTENRSLLAVFAVLFCLAAIQLEAESFRSKILNFAIRALICIAIATNLYIAYITTFHLFDPIRYFVGLESKSNYLARLSPGQKAFDYLNAADDVGRVLLVSAHDPFYLNQAYFFSDYSDPPIAEVLTQDTTTPEAVAQKFKQLNITHVVFNEEGYKKQHRDNLYSWSIRQRATFESFLRKYCKPVARFSDAIVLQVMPLSGTQE